MNKETKEQEKLAVKSEKELFEELIGMFEGLDKNDFILEQRGFRRTLALTALLYDSNESDVRDTFRALGYYNSLREIERGNFESYLRDAERIIDAGNRRRFTVNIIRHKM